MESLPLFHRIGGQTVLVLGEGEAAEAKARLVERAGGIVLRDAAQVYDRAVRLAFVALEDRAEAAAVAEALRAGGLLVNVVDQPDLCDFTTPSILDRSPVLLAMGTGGASAGLAKALRLRLEAMIPQSVGRLAQALGGARAGMRQRWPDAASRRAALDAALSAGGPLDPLKDQSSDAVARWLDGSADAFASGVHLIRLRNDDPDELTLREARWLGAADWLLHEADLPEAILDRARADARRRTIAPDYAIAAADGLTGIVVVVKR